MTQEDVLGICFWCLLYSMPIGLIIKNVDARREILWRTVRFVATWGLVLCVAAGLVAGTFSGLVGIVGAPLGMLLWVVWGSLCYFVVRQNPPGVTNERR